MEAVGIVAEGRKLVWKQCMAMEWQSAKCESRAAEGPNYGLAARTSQRAGLASAWPRAARADLFGCGLHSRRSEDGARWEVAKFRWSGLHPWLREVEIGPARRRAATWGSFKRSASGKTGARVGSPSPRRRVAGAATCREAQGAGAEEVTRSVIRVD